MRQPLFVGFSLVGTFSGACGVRYWLRPPAMRRRVVIAHMSNMLGGCIAAVTAFVVTNAPGWGFRGDSIAVWLGPTAIGIPLIVLWIRRLSGRRPPVITSPAPSGARTAFQRT